MSVCYIFTGLLLIAISIPLVRGSIKMNPLYGVRIKRPLNLKKNGILSTNTAAGD